MKDFLESEEFYRLMQAYRYTLLISQETATERLEAVKEYIRKNIEAARTN